MLLNCGVGEDSWESLGQQGDPNSPSWRKSVLNIHWKDWCWSWNYNTLATWCEELTHWKRPWCWTRLKAGGEGDNKGWDVWMPSLTQWTWVWELWELVMDREAGMLQSILLQRVRYDWTELNNNNNKNSWVNNEASLLKVKVLVAHSCLTLWDSMECSLPGSSVHGISQARVVEWLAISFSRGSTQPGIEPRFPALQADSFFFFFVGRFFTTREVLNSKSKTKWHFCVHHD